jgi:SRSO17 transposase
MDQEETGQPLRGEARLAAYLDAIAGVLGHARRAASARAYCTGLLLPGERKSIEPWRRAWNRRTCRPNIKRCTTW